MHAASILTGETVSIEGQMYRSIRHDFSHVLGVKALSLIDTVFMLGKVTLFVKEEKKTHSVDQIAWRSVIFFY